MENFMTTAMYLVLERFFISYFLENLFTIVEKLKKE